MINNLIQEIESYNGGKYYDLQKIINKYIKIFQDKEEQIPNEILSEYLAFSLFPNETGLSNWGTHFGPFATFNNGDGIYTENPGKVYITEQVLNYWKERIFQSNNLFIKIRYLDLLYDLSEMVIGETIDFSMKINLIEVGILGIKGKIFNPLDGKFLLKRLLDISISLSKKEKIEELENLIINYENQISEDDKPGLWGFSYDYLLNNKKIKLSIENEKKIINDLETKLNKFEDVYLSKFSGNRLAKYYKTKNDNTNLLRVLLKIKEVNYNFIKNNNDGLIISNNFQELINLFTMYQEYKDIKSEKDKIVNDFQQKIKNTDFNFKEISTSFQITDKEMNDYINSFFEDENKIISKICIRFVINKNKTKDLLDDLVKKYPLLYMINKQTVNKNGFVVNNIGSINEDYDANLYNQITQDLHIGSIFIDKVLLKFIEKYKVNDLIKEFRKETIFTQEDEKLLKIILKKYYKGHYLEFNSLVIPFIEKSFRILNEMLGYTVINYKDNKIEYVSLDKLIGSGLIKNIFTTRGEDFELYFRLILTMVEGWNLRNNFAHGIELDFFYNKNVSDRLFHILLCFTLIKITPIN